MTYSPLPPDYTEYIEKNVIPEILKRIKFFCITAVVLIIFPVITFFFDISGALFWIYILFFFVIWPFLLKKYPKIKCPNCGKPIFALAITIPKKCYYCRAKFKE